MKTALITGIAGQDGSYLAEHLLPQQYRVIGAVRDPEQAKSGLPETLLSKVEFVPWDMRDRHSMVSALRAHRPTELYNFAAYSSGERMHEDPVSMGDINGIAVVRILDAIREVDPAIRFCQASSSEMFGLATQSPQSETTPFNPRSPYGVAKLYAHSMIRLYRERHGLFACSAILFNHESPRRRLEFVTRKVTHTAAKIKLGLADHITLGNLEALRDWSFAGDFVRGMQLILQAKDPSDYVLASGITHSVGELCAQAFEYLELDYRHFVRDDAAAYRPVEPVQLVGDASRARNELGWNPHVHFDALIKMMVDADLALLKSHKGAVNIS
jgi:GDPmannose 4,6-dehydratase